MAEDGHLTYSQILDVWQFKELITGLPGLSSLCNCGCLLKHNVLGDSIYSPSETLLLMDLPSLNLVITLLIVALLKLLDQPLNVCNCLSDCIM